MYMSREIFHCKPGKAKELVAKFKKFSEVIKSSGFAPARVFTDVSGENYWTVVIEQEVEKIDDLAEMARKTMSDPKMAAALEGYHDLVLTGKRELYKCE